MNPVDLLVYRQYEVRGVKFIVEINRLKKTVSFVEYDNGDFEQKEWVFSNRELKYMNGWLLILKGMMEVVEELKKELEAFVDEDAKQLMHVALALSKVKDEELK